MLKYTPEALGSDDDVTPWADAQDAADAGTVVRDFDGRVPTGPDDAPAVERWGIVAFGSLS